MANTRSVETGANLAATTGTVGETAAANAATNVGFVGPSPLGGEGQAGTTQPSSATASSTAAADNVSPSHAGANAAPLAGDAATLSGSGRAESAPGVNQVVNLESANPNGSEGAPDRVTTAPSTTGANDTPNAGVAGPGNATGVDAAATPVTPAANANATPVTETNAAPVRPNEPRPESRNQRRVGARVPAPTPDANHVSNSPATPTAEPTTSGSAALATPLSLTSGELTSEPTTTAAERRAAQVDSGVRLEQLAARLGGSESSALAAKPVTVTTANANAGETFQTMLAANGVATKPEEDAFTQRVVRGLSTVVNQRGGVMNMRLHPPELGDLRVQMSIVRGAVTAQFTASTDQANAMLQRNLTVLRVALESHGLTVDKLAVQTANSDQSNASRQEAGDQRQDSSRSNHDAAGRESRGRSDREGAPRHFGATAAFDHSFSEAFSADPAA
ncbi:MAG: hypothetical protein HKO59_17610 [Phycisphaerales bacterium]|nr:hypothetical protein [Phycisphaerales bacterium]